MLRLNKVVEAKDQEFTDEFNPMSGLYLRIGIGGLIVILGTLIFFLVRWVVLKR